MSNPLKNTQIAVEMAKKNRYNKNVSQYDSYNEQIGGTPMSMQEVREQNIALVTQTALACFVENGIEKTTIRDIAQHAGLTERSVYRYFAGKDELVIAAAYLYWDRAKELAAQALVSARRRGMTGIEEIRVLLRSYAGLIFTDPAGIRFSLDAEVALCNAGRQHAVVSPRRAL